MEQESRAELAEEFRSESASLVNLSSYGWCLPIPCSALPSTTRTQGKRVSHYWQPYGRVSGLEGWHLGRGTLTYKVQLLSTPVEFLDGTRKLWVKDSSSVFSLDTKTPSPMGQHLFGPKSHALPNPSPGCLHRGPCHCLRCQDLCPIIECIEM